MILQTAAPMQPLDSLQQLKFYFETMGNITEAYQVFAPDLAGQETEALRRLFEAYRAVMSQMNRWLTEQGFEGIFTGASSPLVMSEFSPSTAAAVSVFLAYFRQEAQLTDNLIVRNELWPIQGIFPTTPGFGQQPYSAADLEVLFNTYRVDLIALRQYYQGFGFMNIV